MIQIQWFNVVLGVLGLITCSVVIIAAYIKTNQDSRKNDREVWQAAVDALEAHNKALLDRLGDAERLQTEQGKEVATLAGAVVTLEKERAAWTQRNMALYDHCQTLRAQVARLGGDPGPTPNGDPR